MDKEILYKTDPSGKFSKKDYLMKYHNELYNNILKYSDDNNISNISFKEKVYCYKYNILPPLCKNPNCNNSVKYKNSTIGYKDFCSIKCISSDPDIKKLKQITSLKKFGTKTPAESKIIKDKMKKTNLERYGYTCSLQNDEIQKKSKLTLLNNYGVDSPLKSKEIQEKRMINFDIEKWRGNFEKTMLERYGVKNALQSNGIINNVKNTNLKKYNVENPNQYPDFIKKRIGTKSNNWKELKLNNENMIDIDLENKEYLMKCDCGKEHEFSIPFSLYKSRKQFATNYCTTCFPPYKNNISQLEVEMYNFIFDNYDGEIKTNIKSIIPPYELDVYLPDLNLAFEFNGLYWHNELNKPNNYHNKKTDLCIGKNIRLIQIYEDDWVYKKDVVKSMIINKLGNNSNKIYARKCEIKEVDDNKLIRKFLDENHVQGYIASKFKLGLYYNDELVSLMILGKKRKSMNSKSSEGEYEMLRFCNKLNTTVIGGASKLFKYFIKNYNPVEVVSYADRSYSDGNLYKQLGFKLSHISKPNYYYVVNDKRKYRFGFRKDILVKQGYDSNKTEKEIMLERKIYRIFNSGNYVFIYNKK